MTTHTTPDSSPMLYLTHARVVLPDTTLDDAAVLVADGRIEAICPSAAPSGAREIDLTGRILMPGMIDLHCDALEKEVEPRPGVHFPLDFACAQADLCGRAGAERVPGLSRSDTRPAALSDSSTLAPSSRASQCG